MSALAIDYPLIESDSSQVNPTSSPRRPATQLVAIEGGKAATSARGTYAVAGSDVLPSKSGIRMVVFGALFCVVSLVVVLVLTTRVVHGSYLLFESQAKVKVLNQEVQSKQELLLEAQASLPMLAAELGMEPAPSNRPSIRISAYVFDIVGHLTGGVGVREMP